jgi:hypothetical protein
MEFNKRSLSGPRADRGSIGEAESYPQVSLATEKPETAEKSTREIVHDFNNLFTIIQCNLKLLIDCYPGSDKNFREMLDDSLSASEDGSKLTELLSKSVNRQP